MQFIGKDAAIKTSINSGLERQIKSIGSLLSSINNYRQDGWVALKSPTTLLLPSFAGKHLKAFSAMVNNCATVFGDNHFFNMALRMSDVAFIAGKRSHLEVAAKRQAMMEAFVAVQNTALYEYVNVENLLPEYHNVHKAVAKKERGFEDHLKKFMDMISWCYTLALLLDDASRLMHQTSSYPALLEEMVTYYEKVNADKEEAILA